MSHLDDKRASALVTATLYSQNLCQGLIICERLFALDGRCDLS